MPLSKGLRDEENQRINNILKKLHEFVFVPDFTISNTDEHLKSLGLNLKTLLDFTSEELINHLDKFHFDWENTEAFADFLILLSNRTGETKLKEKALILYNYTQSESKTFSLEIFNKIASLKMHTIIFC